MDPASVVASAGAIATAVLGVLGLVAPARANAFTSMAPVGILGVSETRATYGGLFLALGLACLALQATTAFTAAGAAWVGAALGRATSFLVDGSREAKNVGGIAFEAAIGAALLAPLWM